MAADRSEVPRAAAGAPGTDSAARCGVGPRLVDLTRPWYREQPFARECFADVVSTSIDVLGDEQVRHVRKWLYQHRGVHFGRRVFLSWGDSDAAVTTWKMVVNIGTPCGIRRRTIWRCSTSRCRGRCSCGTRRKHFSRCAGFPPPRVRYRDKASAIRIREVRRSE